jgi:hypothetical protein
VVKRILVCVLLAFCTSLAFAQKGRVVVQQFANRRTVTFEDALQVTDLVRSRIGASGAVTLVTRDDFDAILKEHKFQMTDWSNAKKTAELGVALGADYIMVGSVDFSDGMYLVTARMIDVNSATQVASTDVDFSRMREARASMEEFTDRFIRALTQTGGGSGGQVRAGTGGKEYKIGDRGPAGGWIFYDKGKVINGWRYLEAAPAEAEFTAEWGAYLNDVIGTATEIGTGKQNTDIIVAFLQGIGERNKAAQLCASLDVDGYKDWFLPSNDELNLMCQNLAQKGLGEFRINWYWSSSEYVNIVAWVQRFSDGFQFTNLKNLTYCVRAVRAF